MSVVERLLFFSVFPTFSDRLGVLLHYLKHKISFNSFAPAAYRLRKSLCRRLLSLISTIMSYGAFGTVLKWGKRLGGLELTSTTICFKNHLDSFFNRPTLMEALETPPSSCSPPQGLTRLFIGNIDQSATEKVSCAAFGYLNAANFASNYSFRMFVTLLRRKRR